MRPVPTEDVIQGNLVGLMPDGATAAGNTTGIQVDHRRDEHGDRSEHRPDGLYGLLPSTRQPHRGLRRRRDRIDRARPGTDRRRQLHRGRRPAPRRSPNGRGLSASPAARTTIGPATRSRATPRRCPGRRGRRGTTGSSPNSIHGNGEPGTDPRSTSGANDDLRPRRRIEFGLGRTGAREPFRGPPDRRRSDRVLPQPVLRRSRKRSRRTYLVFVPRRHPGRKDGASTTAQLGRDRPRRARHCDRDEYPERPTRPTFSNCVDRRRAVRAPARCRLG